MLFFVRVFHWTVLPPVSLLGFHPRDVLLLRSLVWILDCKLNPLNGALALPSWRMLPIYLGDIAVGLT